jgi:hypothetical protein
VTEGAAGLDGGESRAAHVPKPRCDVRLWRRLRACGFVSQSTAVAMRWATGSPVSASMAIAAPTIDRRSSASCALSPSRSMRSEMRSSRTASGREAGAQALRAWYAARLSFCSPLASAKRRFSDGAQGTSAALANNATTRGRSDAGAPSRRRQGFNPEEIKEDPRRGI